MIDLYLIITRNTDLQRAEEFRHDKPLSNASRKVMTKGTSKTHLMI